MPTYAYVSPTSHTDSSGTWNNDANAYDANYSTYANVQTIYIDDGLHWWSKWLELTLSTTRIVDRIRLKTKTDVYYLPTTNIEIYNIKTLAWEEVWNEVLTDLATVEIGIANTTSNKVRIRGCFCKEYDLYELDVRYVIPDDPAVPPPNQSVVIKKEVKSEQATALSCEGSTRQRGVHRRTKLVPVIIS